MAQTVAVVRATLSATSGGTTDFTKSGFGTPTAAIIFTCAAAVTANPNASGQMSVGFWDGTNQRAVGFVGLDAQATSANYRSSDDSYGLIAPSSSATAQFAYTISAITDGIRLTLSVDNTSVERYCTVILLSGVSAKAGTFTPNATQNGTQASASLGFAPELIFFASCNSTAADINGNGDAVFNFGFAEINGTNRCIMRRVVDAQADEAAVIQFSETRGIGAISSSALIWTGEITMWGSDTFTMTTRDGNTSSVVCFFLALGGADLSYDTGTLTTPTSTGDNVNATDVSADALLLYLSTASGATYASDSQANGLMIGATDDDGEFCHNSFVEDGATTTNTSSAAQAAQCIDLDTSSGGSLSNVCDATCTLNASDFTLNYTTVNATARKGWWVAFGPAAAGDSRGKLIGGDLFEAPIVGGCLVL